VFLELDPVEAADPAIGAGVDKDMHLAVYRIILDPALSAGIAAPARTIGSRKWGNVVPSGGIGRSATVAGSYS
ncbi:hypothetical protein, partial [Serratia marcescens]|uniref:hypothetical protein n=1 Tax=Serratia marcescens TaxID=615 RepID=UPI0013DD3032